MSEAKSTVSRECAGVNPSRENDTAFVARHLISALHRLGDLTASLELIADGLVPHDTPALARTLAASAETIADEITGRARMLRRVASPTED